MYGNCKICGKRFGFNGHKWYKSCIHVKKLEEKLKEEYKRGKNEYNK